MQQKPTVYIPSWSPLYEDLTPVDVLRAYENEDESDDEFSASDATYSCDEFRMYEFKIRRCVRGRSHDWTDCPFAHPGEKARRRDPRKYHYSGTACPDFRKGNCKRGDACDMAHGVFECWLHPARYRTQPCKDGTGCRRRVCFFAHTPDQLRVLTPAASASTTMDSYDGSPARRSPPASPSSLLESLRKLHIARKYSNTCFGSPTSVGGFCSLPSTPTPTRVVSGFDLNGFADEECSTDQRVESGRALRMRMYERLSKESGVCDKNDANGPDVGWVSDLLM